MEHIITTKDLNDIYDLGRKYEREDILKMIENRIKELYDNLEMGIYPYNEINKLIKQIKGGKKNNGNNIKHTV